MILLVAIAVSAVGWLSYRDLEQALLLRARDRIETHARQVATDLEYYAASATGDVSGFRSAAALKGRIRARRAGGIDPIDGLSEKAWRDRLASHFAAELEAKPVYALLRMIGLEDEGRELVRIDRAGPNQTVRIVPEADLLQRNGRSYFPETIRLGPGQIYVSPLDLGRRNGLIEEVHRPTLRVATPIFADDGKLFGIFMVNVDMRRAFDRIRTSTSPGETIYVVNRSGDYLIHPDRSREFGGLLGKTNDWKADFPQLASQAGAKQASAEIGPDQAARSRRHCVCPRPSGRRRVGRRHRNHPQRRGSWHRPRHQEHLASGRRDRGVVCGLAGPLYREFADPADRPADRGRSARGPQREGCHSGRCTRRDRRARLRICAGDRRDQCKDRGARTRGPGASPHRSGARASCRA